MSSCVYPYSAYGDIVGPPVSRPASAIDRTWCRTGNTRHGLGIITVNPPGIDRTASVAGSIFSGHNTSLYSPSGMYDLPSPDWRPSWPVLGQDAHGIARPTTPPSYNASTTPHYTGDSPISVSFKPPPQIIQGSMIDFASGYPSSRNARSSEYRINPQFILPEPPISSTQVSQASVSRRGDDHTTGPFVRPRRSWETPPWELFEDPGDPEDDLVRSSYSHSSRSATFSSNQSSQSEKKSRQGPSVFFGRLRNKGRDLLSRFTGAYASVSRSTQHQ